MNAMIFGANGQDGYYITELLGKININCVGISRSGDFLRVDLTNYAEVSDLIRKYQPAYLFHLAAASTTRHSAWKENNDAISTGTINILESVREYSPGTKVFLPGSGLQFRNEGKPIKESDGFEAGSIYAVSRIHSVYAGRYYRSLGLKIYIGYLFNHDSPLRMSNHVNKRIVDAAKRISLGSKETLPIGDLSVRKEFGFAGDIVQGIMTLINQDRIWEATIGTGEAHSIADWVNCCFALCGLDWKDHVENIEGFTREYDLLVSDPSTIFGLGWQPRTSLEELAKMMLS
jgi:GDPmannose 4,6-dehydratase